MIEKYTIGGSSVFTEVNSYTIKTEDGYSTPPIRALGITEEVAVAYYQSQLSIFMYNGTNFVPFQLNTRG